MAGARDFNLVAISSRGIPALEVWIDGSVASGYQRPAWFASPSGGGDDSLKIICRIHHLRSRHESCLLSREVSREVFVKLRRVKISEAVRCFLYRGGFVEVTGKALSVVGLILASIRHVRGDVYQADNRWIRPRFGNYCASVAV